MIHVKRALISVSDKNGILELAKGLAGLGIDIISTGGTASLLRENGIKVIPISEVTGFPEILDGRVKTLTPEVHSGLLARRDKPDHMRQLADLNISTIDLVVVNLYPFEATVGRPGTTFEEAVENIDIGGPTMLRSAAKNFEGVAVVTDPGDYPAVLASLRERDRTIDPAFAYELARKVFRLTSRYDTLISTWLERNSPECHPGTAPEGMLAGSLDIRLRKRHDLRYGENPHQRAAVYEAPGWLPAGLVQAEVLQGKALSYNNYLDLDAAWGIVGDFEEPALAIVKHTNPCGAAVGADPEQAWRLALETDPVSAYGGIVGVNREVTPELARAMSELFLEAVVAPGYHPEAMAVLAGKKSLRLLRLPLAVPGAAVPELRTISGGLLLQDRDRADRLDPGSLKVVTRRAPTDGELRAMLFGWRLVRHLKSNAVAFSSGTRLLSMGSGQTSRVESVRLARSKSSLPLAGSAIASDAFFPFRDGLDLAAEAGATAVIQPGGSVRDAEVVAAADARGMTMVFTGIRHFRH